MSTLRIATSPGQNLAYVEIHGIAAGSAMETSNSVEVKVNQATTAVNDGGSTRQIKKEEVILALETAIEAVTNMSWPYASS